MPHEVRMPQLGMAQDSGIIVAWLKGHGDRVIKGEALFEVETDKATMEVEATADGYLSGVKVGDGADVPVGNVIALIVETEDDVVAPSGEPPADFVADDSGRDRDGRPPATGEATAAASPASESLAAPLPAAPPGSSSYGKVLASPKAKRLAEARGIDLSALRAQGVREPIHAADLKTAATGGLSSLSAVAGGDAFNALLSRAGPNFDRTRLIAAFAAGAWRAVFGVNEVTILVRGLDGTRDSVANPDRGGAGDPGDVVLAVVDLCDTRISGYAPAGGGTTLAVARDGTSFAVTLAFTENTLPLDRAVSFLDEVAARIEDPVRQLL